MWVRLILENSTVCLISRRISLLCPVDVERVPALLVWGCVWCRGFFDNDSGEALWSLFASFVQSGDVALIDSRCSCLLFWVGVGG
jgi:hypothetical protein